MLVEHLYVNHATNNITQHQFAFRRGLGTGNVISSLLNSVYAVFERGEFTITIFLDLTKVLDLLRKLRMCGIKLNENSWVESFLTGRENFISIKRIERDVP